jgi:hypothetical protein
MILRGYDLNHRPVRYENGAFSVKSSYALGFASAHTACPMAFTHAVLAHFDVACSSG